MARMVRKRPSTPPVSDDNPQLFFSALVDASASSNAQSRADHAPQGHPRTANGRALDAGRDSGSSAAQKRRRLTEEEGLVLPQKFTALCAMFDAVTKVADLRLRRGEPPLFSAIAAAAAGLYGKTSDDADLGKNIGVEHIRQMQKIAPDMIRYVERNGRSSTIEVLRSEGSHRMNPMALQSRRSREFRKRLLRITRRYYQRWLTGLPPEQRPDHDAATTVKWDPRFRPDTIPDIPLPGAPGARLAVSASSSSSSSSSSSAAATARARPPAAAARVAPVSCGVSTPELVTPDPVDIRCETGDAIEVQYGSSWYPAVVREMQGARGTGAPPRLMVHVHGWDAGTDAWEPLASTRLRQQQIAEDPAPPRTLPMPPALAAIMAEQRHAHHTVSGINVLVNAKEVALKTQRREDLFRVSQHTLTVSGLPLLADMIKFLFLTTDRTAMYLDDLAIKLLSTHKKVGVTAKIIDEQLELLIRHAPEWCQLTTVGGRKLFSVPKGADAEKVWTSVRPKLKDLVNAKRVEAASNAALVAAGSSDGPVAQ